MEDPREVVEEIRATKFYIGSPMKPPLAVDLQALSCEMAHGLYQKDLHFVMELVQNADDNEYDEGEVPELEFVLVEADLAGVGVEWTLLVLNNEIGFSRANVESLCSFGCSTKKGRRDRGYIGEKGIGFKSVFLVTHHPIVISNGYRIRFNDYPTDDTGLGFIVPQWAEQPTDVELSGCLGISKAELPNTIIVLPIRQDKVQVMQEQLFQLSPQLVLFLNKIDRLSARQLSRRDLAGAVNEPKHMSVHRRRSSPPQEITRMVPNDSSYSMVHLSSPAREATFHVWRQEFPAETDHEVDDRRYIHTWAVTLAFPLDGRNEDSREPNLFAFLPMKVATGFPFIINADFLLISSRDAIRFDSHWNNGILRCIPQAFISAFMFFLRSGELGSAITSLQDVYECIPWSHICAWELTLVRETVLQRIRAQDSILCDKVVGQKFPLHADPNLFLCQPSHARTIDPKFRSLLGEAESLKIPPPKHLATQRFYIVDAEVQKRFEKVLPVIGVTPFTPEDYIECLRSPDWLASLPDAVYVKLLLLLSQDLVKPELLRELPLVKYVDDENKVRLLAPCDKDAVSVHISKKQKDMPILSQWTPIFQRWVNVRFMPNSTIKTANTVAKDKFSSLCEWLKRVSGVHQLSVKSYAMKLVSLCKEVPTDASLILGTTHFLLHAIQDGYLSEDKCGSLIAELPLLDCSGDAHSRFKGPVLLPASVCKWPLFLSPDSWKGHVLRLSESYLELPPFLNNEVGSDLVIQFLRHSVKAVDIFDIEKPPDAPLFIPSPWSLSASDVKSFLTWLKGLSSIPFKLRTSLKESDWVKTVEHGDKKPSMSFLDMGQWNNVLTSRDVPFVDTRFYGDLKPFGSTLTELGMVTKPADGAHAVADHVQILSMTSVIEVPIDMASRWYKYLRMNNWMGWRGQNVRMIWVPNGGGNSLGLWRSRHECVTSDKGGLFHDRLCVLDRFYKDEAVLMFFKDNVGVAATPGTEKHCQLWIEWGEKRGTVGKEDCQSVWCMIAKGWDSFAEKGSWELEVFLKRCRIPCEALESDQVSNTLCLARPSEVLYADNLILAETFHQAFPSLKFAWYPRNADAAPWVGQLVRCYTVLGVKRLSEALVGGGPGGYVSRVRVSPDLCGKGNIGIGVYRAILGYLADPKHMLSAEARKRMVMQLKNVEVWLVDEVGEVEYEVSVGGKVYAASRTAHVRWEKGEKRIYVAMPGRCNKAQVAHELAGEVAKGIVGGERVLLVQGLQDLLLVASCVHFEDDSVQYLLWARNLRLTLEDEAFLHEQRFERETTPFF